MPRFSIPVFEYSSAHRKPGPEIAKKIYFLDDRKLVCGMVRSLLTIHAFRTSRAYAAAIGLLALEFMIDLSRTPDLILNSRFATDLRDFSVTSRVGELAQAISYSYWKWEGGYTCIGDFKSTLAHHHIMPPKNLKTPDYIMLDRKNNILALMESKGTLVGKHKKYTQAALKQIQGVCTPVIHPYNSYIKRGWASVVDFNQLTHPATVPAYGPASLYLRDPEVGTECPDSICHDVFRSSYASWFDLLGEEYIAKWCRKPLKKSINQKKLKPEAINRSTPLLKRLIAALGFKNGEARFVIDPTIEKALSSEDAFREIKEYIPKKSNDSDCESPGSAIYFPDGTQIIPA